MPLVADLTAALVAGLLALLAARWYARSAATPERPAEEVARTVGEAVKPHRGPTAAARAAARPRGRERPPADARARRDTGRRARARRARPPRAPGRAHPARRQLRGGMGVRPPEQRGVERPAAQSPISAASGSSSSLPSSSRSSTCGAAEPDWAALFLLVVLVGMELAQLGVKDLVGRVRPTLDPAAARLGPSFPSGHSATAAAFYAAAALVIGRNLPSGDATDRRRRSRGDRGRSRGESCAPRPALAVGRRRRPRARLGLVRTQRRRLRRTGPRAHRGGRRRGGRGGCDFGGWRPEPTGVTFVLAEDRSCVLAGARRRTAQRSVLTARRAADRRRCRRSRR